jgi:hypothetical protein
VKPTEEEDDEENEEEGRNALIEIYNQYDYGPDSWLIHEGIRWVYFTDGMYISEFGNMKEL